MRQNLTDLAEIWTKLAAEIEFDSGLLHTLSELEFSEPYDAFPRALAAQSASASRCEGGRQGDLDQLPNLAARVGWAALARFELIQKVTYGDYRMKSGMPKGTVPARLGYRFWSRQV